MVFLDFVKKLRTILFLLIAGFLLVLSWNAKADEHTLENFSCEISGDEVSPLPITKKGRRILKQKLPNKLYWKIEDIFYLNNSGIRSPGLLNSELFPIQYRISKEAAKFEFASLFLKPEVYVQHFHPFSLSSWQTTAAVVMNAKQIYSMLSFLGSQTADQLFLNVSNQDQISFTAMSVDGTAFHPPRTSGEIYGDPTAHRFKFQAMESDRMNSICYQIHVLNSLRKDLIGRSFHICGSCSIEKLEKSQDVQ